MTKKIVLIIGILVIVGVAIFFIMSGESSLEGDSTGSRVGFSIRDYFPFGRDTSTGNDQNSGNADEGNNTTENFDQVLDNKPIDKLRKISSEPVAGAVVFNQGTTSIVRFVERGTGNVYEARSDSNIINRLSNTTIPKIVRAYWLPDGSGFIAQTISLENEIIETSLVKLKKNTTSASEDLTPYSTTISSLPTNIKEIAVSPDGRKIFYYTKSSISQFYTANPDGTGETLVATHPLTEWIPFWKDNSKIVLQTKADSSLVGYAYTLDLNSRAITKNGFGLDGLTINPNQTGAMIVSTGGNRPIINIRSTTGNYTTINTSTLAEKCTWLNKAQNIICAIPNGFPRGSYPQDWYKGLVSTEDFIIGVDLSSTIAYNVSNLVAESGQKIDVEEIMISKDDSHLIFRNKIDGFLWLLRVSE